MKVKLTGFDPGILKIALTKLQVDYFQLSMLQAKSNVDKLVAGETVEIAATSKEQAQEFVYAAREIGAICVVD